MALQDSPPAQISQRQRYQMLNTSAIAKIPWLMVFWFDATWPLQSRWYRRSAKWCCCLAWWAPVAQRKVSCWHTQCQRIFLLFPLVAGSSKLCLLHSIKFTPTGEVWCDRVSRRLCPMEFQTQVSALHPAYSQNLWPLLSHPAASEDVGGAGSGAWYCSAFVALRWLNFR